MSADKHKGQEEVNSQFFLNAHGHHTLLPSTTLPVIIMDDCETITDATNRDAVDASRSHDSPLMNKSFSPRRSNRLRHSLSTQTERVLHRTHAGGVAADGSPKLSSRKTIIASTNRSLSAVNNRTSKSIQSKTIEIDSESDGANEEQTSADSSQSTSNQEKGELAANRLRIYHRRPSNSNLLTRAQILEHYEWNSDGFKCKICGEVVRVLFVKK